MIYKFTQHAADFTEVKSHKLLLLHRAFAKYGEYKNLPKEYKGIIETYFSEISNPDLYRFGIFKYLGWAVSFEPWTNLYWVKMKHYGITEVRTFNKTLVRKLSANPNWIIKIVQVN